MKDKRAITTQILVIDASRNRVEEVEIPDTVIEVLGRTHHKVGMGDHDGNRFTITVRGCCDASGDPIDAKEAMRRVHLIREGLAESIGSDAFPNWIGPQRFGSTRPVTPEVGRAVVEGDFERAVDLYVGMEATRESEESAVFREAWRESKDPAPCLEIAPRRLGYERAMLEHLLKKPDDHLGAFRTLPNSLQLLMVHSIQSLAFNHSMSARLEAGLPIIEPVVGDLVAPLQPNQPRALQEELRPRQARRHGPLAREGGVLRHQRTRRVRAECLGNNRPDRRQLDSAENSSTHDLRDQEGALGPIQGPQRGAGPRSRQFAVRALGLRPERRREVAPRRGLPAIAIHPAAGNLRNGADARVHAIALGSLLIRGAPSRGPRSGR
jgi:hypothetical protein